MADLFDHATGQPAPARAAKPADPSPPPPAGNAQAPKEPPKAAPPKPANDGGYTAADIEVLEGLEPVRKRPGMYVGGTDERAFHHLAAEIIDNAMDEAVAGHASRIEIELHLDGRLSVRDNGRGIPVDPHPKFKNLSALEVILTTLHSGGKFKTGAYVTSGGLHGVGLSVVNALSADLVVEVARDKTLWRQTYAQGKPQDKLANLGAVQNRRGTLVTFRPDPEIFGEEIRFKPSTLYRLARSKAYLFKGVEIRWSCDPGLLGGDDVTPPKEAFHFPGGLADYLASALKDRAQLTEAAFTGESGLNGSGGRVEWAVGWPHDEEGFSSTYCNTVPTPQGGTHETGLRSALSRALRSYGELVNNKQAAKITAEDVMGGAAVMLSVFIPEPQFQGQTKDKLANAEAHRLVEAAVRDHFDHWLSGAPEQAAALLERTIERAETRLKRRFDKETKRQSATRRVRLPGKLADCTRKVRDGTEIFIVEGDSAGGSAKQARKRETQAVLPLRGKILNVASASSDKLRANQEIKNLSEALGCGTGDALRLDDLRYERVIIMTDADVDGAHIASLLMTYFFVEMRPLIEGGHLFLALPPLYRLSQGAKTAYARDDAHKDQLLNTEFKGKAKVEISRFKGLGEMLPAQLRETTMDPDQRSLLRVVIGEDGGLALTDTARLVDDLMGKKPERRFQFIRENADLVDDIDV